MHNKPARLRAYLAHWGVSSYIVARFAEPRRAEARAAFQHIEKIKKNAKSHTTV